MNYSPDVMIMICFVSFSIAFMKGAFGGGLAAIGIPLLSLVMPPFEAAALIAPLLVLMDAFSLRYWSPQTWSKPASAMGAFMQQAPSSTMDELYSQRRICLKAVQEQPASLRPVAM